MHLTKGAQTMAERYSRLFSLPEDLYTAGAPLVIAAGALLMDNQSGKVLAQLKMRSISDKVINSIKLLVTGTNRAGDVLCREEHVYEGLNAARDSFFGQREAVLLSDVNVRSFTVQLLNVSFSDGSRYIGGVEEWKPLPAQADLNQRLFDTELIRQYRLETSNLSRFVPMETQDLWLCACGEINRKGESCHRCDQTLEQCKKYLSVDLLRENKNLRLNSEAVQAALDEARRQSRGKLLRRILLVLVPLVLVAGIAFGAHKIVERRDLIYGEACRLYNEGEFAQAAVLFDKLGHYKDAGTLAAKAKKSDAEIASYNRAAKLLDNGRWDDAHDAFAALGKYEDSAELAQEALYRKGQTLLEREDYAAAREVFEGLGNYRDAAEIAAHFFSRRLSEEASLNPECNGPLTTTYRYDSCGRIAEKVELFSAYPGMSDRVSVYDYDADGSYTVTENQVAKRYDAYDSYIGQGDLVTNSYEYDFYPDGSVHYRIGTDARTGAYLNSAAYDEHGNQIAVQGEDGANYTLLNEYNGDQLSRQERYDDEGTMLSRVSFEYDDEGLLKRAIFLTPGATTTATVLYNNGPIYAPDAVE